MWTLVVVLMLGSGELVYTRHELSFAKEADCRYALSFLEHRDSVGQWAIAYAACEPRTSV